MVIYNTEEISSRREREKRERETGNGAARADVYPARFIFRIDSVFSVASGTQHRPCSGMCLYSSVQVIERHDEGKQKRR